MNQLALPEIVKFAYYNCPFYQRLYDSAGISVETVVDENSLATVPTTNVNDILDHHRDFRPISIPIFRVSSSSGTTNKPKTVYRTSEDNIESVSVVATLFKTAGLTKGDSLLISQPSDLAHLGSLCLEACRSLQVEAIPVGISFDDDRMLDYLERYSPTAVFTSPSRMSRVTYLATKSKQPFQTKKILLAGEPASAAQMTNIKSYWGDDVGILYGSEETDGLAGTCSHGRMHFMADHFVLELDETREEAGAVIGNAVISSLYLKGTPLIRYELGDVIRRYAEPCSCGISFPVIEVLGRSTDTLFLYDGVKLHAYQVHDCVESVLGEAVDFQVKCSDKESGILVEIKLDPRRHVSDEHIQALQESIWSCSLDLEPLASMDIRFRFVADEEFDVSKRGKTPKIIDTRTPTIEV